MYAIKYTSFVFFYAGSILIFQPSVMGTFDLLPFCPLRVPCNFGIGDLSRLWGNVRVGNLDQLAQAYHSAEKARQIQNFRTPEEYIRNAGYRVDTHKVVTRDGYILTMQRIPCGQSNHNCSVEGRPAILLVHGLTACAINWVSGCYPCCLPYLLADAGYDVWLANVRGTLQSQGHANRFITRGSYWTFSWHEMGVYDLPAKINYILYTTRQRTLNYVGHSQGTTSFFVMMSSIPEMNDKINQSIMLAPVAFMEHASSAAFLLDIKECLVLTLFPGGPSFTSFGIDPTLLASFLGSFGFHPCESFGLAAVICSSTAFITCGYNFQSTNYTALTELLSTVTNPAAFDSFRHYAQGSLTKGFALFDYGLGNKRKYGQCDPPQYNLRNIRCNIAMMYAENDLFSNVTDVFRLQRNLVNARLTMFRVPDTNFNHLDYFVANNCCENISKNILHYLTTGAFKDFV